MQTLHSNITADLSARRGDGEITMSDCRYCENADTCQHIGTLDDCEDFEETFEHHWDMMDDIEKEEYNSYMTKEDD